MRWILVLRGLLIGNNGDGMGGRVKEYDMGEGDREANVVERLCDRRCAIVIKESINGRGRTKK
jgi:hypothetical protein